MAGLVAGEFQLLREAVDERRCREEVGVGTLVEAAILSDGPEMSGVRRSWRLDGRFHHCRRPEVALPLLRREVHLPQGRRPRALPQSLATWVSFLKVISHNFPVECAAEPSGVTHKTAFEWRHRVIATVSGYKDRIVLRDTVWVDETYVNDTDLSKGYGQVWKSGLSRQKLCICVAIDIHKYLVEVVCGHGKPSSAQKRSSLFSYGSVPFARTPIRRNCHQT